MRKGFTFVVLVAVIGFLLIVGTAGYVTAKNFTGTNKPRKFDFINNKSVKETPKPNESPFPSVVIAPSSKPSPEGVSGESGLGGTVYAQPLGKFTVTLPAGWTETGITSTLTYTTTKFSGPSGHISITYGTGKDPIGGCSDNSSVTLADRTIGGCFILQKDGSQLLTRVYTKDKAGLDYTIEAYINQPISSNKVAILDIIRTIQIN